jgi:hypothetical protein
VGEEGMKSKLLTVLLSAGLADVANMFFLPRRIKSSILKPWCRHFLYISFLLALPSQSFSAEDHILFKKFHNQGPIKVTPYPLVRGSQVTSQGRIPFIKDTGSWVANKDLAIQSKTENCSPRALEASLLNAGKNTYTWSKAAQSFFTRCQSQLTVGAPSPNGVLLKVDSLKYQLQLHPDFREIEISLPQGTKLAGFLALKRSTQPRPLVIIKCGIFCDNQPGGLGKLLTMHLFDESPFHVLIVENVTSATFVKANKRVGVGGMEEGRHIIEIAQILQDTSEIRHHITEVHTISPSLGGHAALYASLYNDYHPLKNSRPAIASSMALCPVVNLENSFSDLFTGIKRDFVFSRMIRTLLGRIFPYIDLLQERYDPAGDLSNDVIKGILSEANFEYYKDLEAQDFWFPFSKRLTSLSDLWERNNFVHQAHWLKMTPTLLVAADDDWVVRSSRNARLLDKAQITGKGSPINTLHLEHGSHCGFSLSYGWDYFGILIRNYVLSHSPQFSSRQQWREVPLPSSGLPQLKSGERHIEQKWEVSAHSDTAQLTYKIWKGPEDSVFGPSSCTSLSSRFESGSKCFRFDTQKISFLKIDSRLHRPKNVVEAQAMSRALNSKWQILSRSGEALHDSDQDPQYIRWLD